jgi:hypothetical protein
MARIIVGRLEPRNEAVRLCLGRSRIPCRALGALLAATSGAAPPVRQETSSSPDLRLGLGPEDDGVDGDRLLSIFGTAT